MLIGQLNQIGLILSISNAFIRIPFFNCIVVLRNVCHKHNDRLKTCFPDLVAMTYFNVHQPVASVAYRQSDRCRRQVLFHCDMSKVNASIGGFYKRQSVLIHDF